jgi:ESCRT-II complex subunit VPS36
MERLEGALKQRPWENASPGRTAGSITARPIGVTGLLKRADEEQKAADSHLSGAFDDLNALMDNAHDLVRLAESISSKIILPPSSSAATAEGDDRLAAEHDLRALLRDIGLTSSVSRDVQVGSSSSADRSGSDIGDGMNFETAHGTIAFKRASPFIEDLAREMGNFIGLLMSKRRTAIIPVTDAYCLYNRARGINLVSPEDFISAAHCFGSLRLPVELMKIPIGSANSTMLVFQSMNEGAVYEHILSTYLSSDESFIDPLGLCQQERYALSIAMHYLRQAECKGYICRDEQGGGAGLGDGVAGVTRYYKNLFLSSSGAG